MLAGLGVTDIGYDDLREVGRGSRTQQPSSDQLCGLCASGNLAVGPDGTVWPCVFARWLPVGNLREASLRDVLTGPDMASVTAHLKSSFGLVDMPCVPKMCNPECGPSCGPACRPHELGKSGAQVICATHSPVLAATPDADIIEFGDHGIRHMKWEELELVDHWRRFMARPELYLRHLVDDEDDGS